MEAKKTDKNNQYGLPWTMNNNPQLKEAIELIDRWNRIKPPKKYHVRIYHISPREKLSDTVII